jgi:catalase
VISPRQAIDIVNARFGAHPHTRALHAKGSWCEGSFTATPAAARLSRAAHLQGATVPVRARVSNGGGDPTAPDAKPDVRGLAVSFTLPDAGATDMVAQSVPRFFSSTPDEFLEFIRAATGPAAAVRMPAFFATHPKAVRFLPANAAALRPVPSYAQTPYYGVHAFVWVDAAGTKQALRWTWVPQAGEQHVGPRDARSRDHDYLQSELRERLAAGPIRFRLELQLAAPGDPTADPSTQWPADRERIDAGMLELTAVTPDPEADGGLVVFDPTRMTDGVELSDDPFLAYRAAAYSESVARRTA